jgi:ArsR family transcriptional regulator, cadmium/lead-responsive transcriptional repressor
MLQERALTGKLFRSLGDESRLQILDVLQDTKTVSKIVTATGLSQPNISMHLSCLLNCGLVKKEKKGRECYYSLADSDVKKLISLSHAICLRHAKDMYMCANFKSDSKR